MWALFTEKDAVQLSPVSTREQGLAVQETSGMGARTSRKTGEKFKYVEISSIYWVVSAAWRHCWFSDRPSLPGSLVFLGTGEGVESTWTRG